MSDAFRKDFSTKASEKMQPDSSKSTLEKTKETITGAGDKAARGAEPGTPSSTNSPLPSTTILTVLPDSEKSTTQSIGDKFGRSKDNEVHGGSSESVLDKAKGAIGMDRH